MKSWLLRIGSPLVTEKQLQIFAWDIPPACRIELPTDPNYKVDQLAALLDKKVPQAGAGDRFLVETLAPPLHQKAKEILIHKGYRVFIPTWKDLAQRIQVAITETVDSILKHGYRTKVVDDHEPNGKAPLKPQRKRRRSPSSPTPKQQPRPISQVHETEVDHRLFKLTPSSRWHVVMDESQFDFTSPSDFTQSGKMVAVIFPDRYWYKFQALSESWHSTKQGLNSINDRLQKLLNFPVGIVGVAASEYPSILGDKYPTTVTGLIALILRFLPVDGQTNIEVFVERRGDNDVNTNWKMAAMELMRQLAELDPARAAQIKLQIKTIAKGDHPLLGYADVIGYTWSPKTRGSVPRLYQSGLARTCLIPNYATLMNQVWDRLASGRRIDPEQWREYVIHDSANDPETLPGHLFERVKQACREDRSLWNQYATATLRHLESKAVDLTRLHREIAWLRDCAPELPPKLELAFLTALLAEANHSGQAFFDAYQQIERLTSTLVEEDPALCCWADLHLAVSCTNRFAFFEALQVIGPWLSVGPLVPGLQMWARVRSTAGQLAAFGGQYKQAVTHFNEALDAFSRLSDPEEAARERQQTATYKAIALLDDPRASREAVLEALTVALGKLDDAVSRLAASDAPADKYLHHLLLRFLALHPEGAPWVKPYLRRRKQWKTGPGHPWEWIEAYRALLLLSDGQLREAKLHADHALALALEPGQGPILQWIGLVQARLFLSLELTISCPLPDQDELVALLPGLTSRTAALSRLNKPHLQRPLTTLLPFNFH